MMSIVKTCSRCSRDFWAGDHNDDLCFTCSHKIRTDEANRVERERKQSEQRLRRAEKKEEREINEYLNLKPETVRQAGQNNYHNAGSQAPANFGYVYLMRSGNGFHKIGISIRVEERLQGLKRQFPIQIEVVHHIACHDYRKVERFLHNKYSGKRAEYEWFNLDAQDVEWITALKDYELG